ncbi:two-component sensor histidine kinase [Paenibacillus donghaensis]|uniref:sensor histidine kinase n=1 Tax=Paenibacillus donghaensis TaxID=414771 RepID=UPI0018835A32|nr:HAMP domain-containing sensor histidine kinase [Paenibacillus donghaensis]MBE9917783.1 two-component sensor histidine kinase [Paenibacillus donghaensis]
MMFWQKAWRILALIIVFLLCWSMGFLLVFWLNGGAGTSSLANDYVRQGLALVFGGLLEFIVLLIYFKLKPKTHRLFFQNMTEVLQQIGKGDYRVQVDTDPKRIGPYEPVASSINQMAEDLGRLERMRQEFISNVSHEIQSPLTSISGFSRELLDNDTLDDKERKEILEIIELESKRISKLSRNLLRLTSLESEQYPFEPKRYRLDRQLRAVVLACEPQWVEKKLNMDIELASVTVFADEDTLNQVWFNLLNNSIKFTPAGGTISISLQQRKRGSVVIFRDNGCGIDKADIPYVFDRFYKADKSRNREAGGSGLGLSIAKKIIDMHHGGITVNSSIGEGAVFTVTLPISS